MASNSDNLAIQHGAEGVCPKCGGSLFTVDGIILECDTCEYVSSDMSLIENN